MNNCLSVQVMKFQTLEDIRHHDCLLKPIRKSFNGKRIKDKKTHVNLTYSFYKNTLTTKKDISGVENIVEVKTTNSKEVVRKNQK